jgi:hypothetical protein
MEAVPTLAADVVRRAGRHRLNNDEAAPQRHHLRHHSGGGSRAGDLDVVAGGKRIGVYLRAVQ